MLWGWIMHGLASSEFTRLGVCRFVTPSPGGSWLGNQLYSHTFCGELAKQFYLFRHILKLQSELLSQVCCYISLLSLGLFFKLASSSSKSWKKKFSVCFRVFLCTYCVVQRHTSSPHSSWPIIIIKLNCRRHCLHSFISHMTSCELLLRKAIYTTSIYM